MQIGSIRQWLSRFGRDEDGGVMIEAILWLPVFLSIFVIIADASVLFMNQARIKRIMQDGNRQMATGVIGDCDEMRTWLETNVRTLAPTATAACDEDVNVSTTTVSASAEELDLTGVTGLFGAMTINVSVVYHLEVG